MKLLKGLGEVVLVVAFAVTVIIFGMWGAIWLISSLPWPELP
jgi:F0F1-type ATP synthase membrane subunit c/vacuolar-type H+-ATPase subunit K